MTGEPHTNMARRGILRGLAGAGTLGIATIVSGRPASAQEDVEYVVLGGENVATTSTRISASVVTATPSDEAALDVRLSDGVSGATAPAAIRATSEHSTAVRAVTDDGFAATMAVANDAFAVWARNSGNVFPAIYATNDGTRGALAGWSKAGPQLVLYPSETQVGPPESGAYCAGSLLFDAAGDLYLNLEDEGSSWVRLVREDQLPSSGRTVVLDESVQLRDLAVRMGTSLTVGLDETTGVPADAGAVVGTMTVTQAPGDGYITVQRPGAEQQINAVAFDAEVRRSIGCFTCGVAPRQGRAAFVIRAKPDRPTTVRVRIDVTAYVTG